jgi:hypothetical protein
MSGSAFLAVARHQDGQFFFTTSKSEDMGAGVLLDTCVAIITVETEARFWLFWMAPDASGKVQGHTISGDKEAGEVNVLADFCHDLTTVAHFSRLHQVHSLEEAERVLIDRVKVTPQAAQGIVAYLSKN